MEQYDAIIIGGGFAGIRALQTLINSGTTTNILLLEANSYLGGRIKTTNLSDNSINDPTKLNDIGNIPIEIGGEWIYDGNDMESYLLSNGYLDLVDVGSPTDNYLSLPDAQYYIQYNINDTAVPLSNAETNALRTNVWDGYLSYREKVLDADNYEPISVATVAEQYKSTLSNNSNIDKQYFQLILNGGVIDYTADISELNLEDYRWYFMDLDNDVCEVTYMSRPGVGFGNVAADIAMPYMDKHVRLNSKVTEIDYSNAPDYAIISYENGDGGGITKVIARTVLVTASLGALKMGAINFVPTLPDWKQEVIDGMGFGVMNKWVGMWDEKDAMVWPKDDPWFTLITPEDEGSGRWTTFMNPTAFKGDVPTLIGWVGGAVARSIEDQTDEEITEDVMKNLKILFPDITPPDRVLVSRWGKEPNIYGTYTYKPVGRDHGSDARALRRQVGNIRFAGESTDNDWYGTTYGAWRTGEEEAEDMATEIESLPPVRYVVDDVDIENDILEDENIVDDDVSDDELDDDRTASLLEYPDASGTLEAAPSYESSVNDPTKSPDILDSATFEPTTFSTQPPLPSPSSFSSSNHMSPTLGIGYLVFLLLRFLF